MEREGRKPTRRRESHDIMIGILEIAQHGERKSHIINKANLSHKQAEYYLGHLLSKNFIKKEDKFYRTTEKGLNVLEFCKMCLKLLD